MTQFFTSTGKIIITENIPEKCGGEGSIFLIPSDKSICLKIFSPHILEEKRDELEKKFKIMNKNPPNPTTQPKDNHQTYTWPLELIYNNNGAFLGFTMYYSTGIGLTEFINNTQVFLPGHAVHNEPINWLHLFKIARNVALAVKNIHNSKHRIGDMKPANILVKNLAVTFVDCNSFLIYNPDTCSYFKSELFTQGYRPPERFVLNQKQLQKYDWIYSDRWVLSVIIFQVLMCGFHPFHAIVKTSGSDGSLEGNVLLGAYPYSGNQKDICDVVTFAPNFKAIIPPPLQMMFHNCFDKNKGYSNPDLRPTADEWVSAMDNYLTY